MERTHTHDSGCSHSHSTEDVKYGHATDPTGTRKLRARYTASINGRLRRVKAQVRKMLIKDGLLNTEEFRRATTLQRSRLLTARIDLFLNELVDLNPEPHLLRAYRKAIRDTAKDVGRKARLPEIEGSQLSTYSRARRVAFNKQALRKMAGDLHTDIQKAVLDAYDENPNIRGRQMAKVVTDRVDTTGVVRAKVIANTEVIATYADGALDYATEEGYAEVEAEVEFTTAGDRKVCPLCRPMSGSRYTVAEARGILPVHPNCRCRWRLVASSRMTL